MKELVYIASPYKSMAFAQSMDEVKLLNEAIKKALYAAMAVKKAGYIPVSPVVLFGPIYDEKTEREEALKAGLQLLKKCDLIFVLGEAKKGSGMEKELLFARRNGIRELQLQEKTTYEATIIEPDYTDPWLGH